MLQPLCETIPQKIKHRRTAPWRAAFTKVGMKGEGDGHQEGRACWAPGRAGVFRGARRLCGMAGGGGSGETEDRQGVGAGLRNGFNATRRNWTVLLRQEVAEASEPGSGPHKAVLKGRLCGWRWQASEQDPRQSGGISRDPHKNQKGLPDNGGCAALLGHSCPPCPDHREACTLCSSTSPAGFPGRSVPWRCIRSLKTQPRDRHPAESGSHVVRVLLPFKLNGQEGCADFDSSKATGSYAAHRTMRKKA